MRTSTTLIRIRFPHDLVERLDQLAERLRLKERRRIPRAAVIRALVEVHMPSADDDRRELDVALDADPIKQGREKNLRPARRARSNTAGSA